MMRFLHRLIGSWDRAMTARRPAAVRRLPGLECLEDRSLLDASPLLLQAAPDGPETVRLQLPSLADLPLLRTGAVGATLRNAWFSPGATGRLTAAFLVGSGGAGPGRLVVLSDFNRDGLPDLAVNTGDRVSVALGQPDGTFRVSYLLLSSTNPGDPGSLISGDFDRDGITDVLAVNRGGKGDAKVSLLFGTGDGSFRLALDFWLSSPEGGDARLRNLVEPGRISVASWSPQSRDTLESLGLLPAPVAPPKAEREAVRTPAAPAKPSSDKPEPKQEKSEKPSPTPSPPDPVVREVVRREEAKTAPAPPAHARPATPAVQPAEAGVMDAAAIALVHVGGAELPLTPDAMALAVAAHLPPADATIAAVSAVTSSALAAPEVNRPPSVAPQQRATPRPSESTGLWAAWTSSLASGLAADVGLCAGVLAPSARPLIGDVAVPPLAAMHKPADARDNSDRRRSSGVWLEWGQVVLPLLYLGTVGRAVGAGVATAPLQTPSESQMLLADVIRRSTETFTRLVQQFYQTFLGREAVEGEEQGWVGMLLAGRTEEEVLAAFLGTAEFRDRAVALSDQGTPDERFVRGLHGLLLSRPGTDAELEGYLAALPALGREGVAGLLLRSQEYRTLQIGEYLAELTGQPAAPEDAAAWAASPFDLLTVRAFLHQAAEARTVS